MMVSLWLITDHVENLHNNTEAAGGRLSLTLSTSGWLTPHNSRQIFYSKIILKSRLRSLMSLVSGQGDVTQEAEQVWPVCPGQGRVRDWAWVTRCEWARSRLLLPGPALSTANIRQLSSSLCPAWSGLLAWHGVIIVTTHSSSTEVFYMIIIMQ